MPRQLAYWISEMWRFLDYYGMIAQRGQVVPATNNGPCPVLFTQRPVIAVKIARTLREEETLPMNEETLLERITVNPEIFGGKPIIRGRRLAVEHVLGMLAAGDSTDTILEGYPWLESEDVLACLVYARRMIGHERVEPMFREYGP